ncbi:hypothetical protein BKA82DRAFT_14158 [Pisolithus tinctorius]|uniref:F-box domain-containing protein n=1 Tax=Pisolithus tinctorius Marx 270 TaxID=870435 RepID=A0A0C3PMT3_PISTI|nr:hypothetical protein BKA82DRAFT_14158 [Pisolithus tinctorius]KIO09674.1 hypothetical protein M404DRAFT_14158 [Pisolithus tinctorius Marx 270]
MHNLPIELVKEIVDNVSDTPDLFHLRAVNSTCRDLVDPSLFHRICIGNSVKSAQNILQIFATPSLAPFIHEVVYDPRENHPFLLLRSSDAEVCCDEIEIAELEEALTETFTSLSNLPNLKSVTLNFWPSFISQSGAETRDHPYWFTSRQLTVLHSVYHAMKNHSSSPSPYPGIRSLTLNNVVLMPTASYDFVRSLTDSPLTHLSISVVSNSELFAWSGSKTLNGSVEALLPVPNDRLTSLEIKSPRGLYHSPSTHFSAHTYPSLRCMVLENIVLDDATSTDGVEEFILRHKNSLKKLEMKSCMSYIQSIATPVRKWATIWERLREELTELEEVVVDDGGCGYAVLNTSEGYIPHSDVAASTPSLLEDDEQSLKDFCECVNARAAGSS